MFVLEQAGLCVRDLRRTGISGFPLYQLAMAIPMRPPAVDRPRRQGAAAAFGPGPAICSGWLLLG
eukprot:1216880-Prymnesium_polylepis.1